MIPDVPLDFLETLHTLPAHEVHVEGYHHIPGIKLAGEWIGCGRYGVVMHDDQHIPARYNVLLVAHGEHGWRLATVGRSRLVSSISVSRGAIVLLDAYKAHALYHVDGEHPLGWAALSWCRSTEGAAKSILRRVSKIVRPK